MDFIAKLRAVRAVERAARRMGLADDATVDRSGMSSVGTIDQQAAIVLLGLESGVRVADLSPRDREWVGELLRACVLSPGPAADSTPAAPARRRAW